MTWQANQPVSTQSPADFPAGSLANNTQVKNNINAEHVFNDTTGVDDGVHRQMTMVDRADPTPPLPAGTSSMLFTKSTPGTPASYFYDATTVYQNQLSLSGTTSIAANTTTTIFTGAFDYQAQITVYYDTGVSKNMIFYVGTRTSSVLTVAGISTSGIVVSNANNIAIKNPAGSATYDFLWTVSFVKI